MNKNLKILFLLFCTGIFREGNAQTNNLILNSYFEEIKNDSLLLLWGGGGALCGNIPYWDCAGWNTSDYFHVNGRGPGSMGRGWSVPFNLYGSQMPHSGYGYAGSLGRGYLPNHWREYMQGTLRKPLNAGQAYAFRVYVSRADNSKCISNFAVVVSDTPIYLPTSEVITIPPVWRNDPTNPLMDSVNWQVMEGSLLPTHGGERYLTFGVMDSTQHLINYYCTLADSLSGNRKLDYGYYVDDMALIDTSEVDTVRMCVNDSLYFEGAWRKGAGMFTSTIGGLPVRHYLLPVTDTSRVKVILLPLEPGDSTKAGYVWIFKDSTLMIQHPSSTGCDSTVYYICGKGSPNGLPEYVQAPISVQTLLTDEHWYIDGLQAKDEVKVWDIQGKSYSVQALNSKHFLIENMSRGMYFYHILREGRVLQQGKLVKVE